MIRATIRDVTALAAVGAAGAATTALVGVALGLQASLRDWYALRLSDAPTVRYADVLLTDLHVCAVPLLGAALLACWPHARPALDALLAALLGLNATLVGAAIGASGGQLANRVAAHATVELLGAAVAGTAYLDVRRGRCGLRALHFAGCAGAVAALLGAGALLGVHDL